MEAFLRRVLALFRRNRLDRELDDELAFHLAMREGEHLDQGAARDEARRAARHQFGNVVRVKEQSRVAWVFHRVEALILDLRLAWRSLRRSPGFALVAVSTIACGIAVANTTFAIVNGALIRSLPFAHQQRLVHIGFRTPRAEYGSVSYPEWLDLQAIRSLQLAAYAGVSITLSDDGRAPDRMQGTYVSAHGFELLGIRAVVGRGLLPEDDAPTGSGVAVLSESVWKHQYGGDPRMVGRTVRVNGQPATIVGIVPTRYTLTARSDIWLPLMQMPDLVRQERTTRALSVFGALTDGNALYETRQELTAMASRLQQEHPDAYKDIEPIAISLMDRLVHPEVQQVFLVLFGAGLVVLVIACANVANLLLARTANRQHEIATRIALGASRWQIWRQLLCETLILGLVSGVVALGLSALGIRLFTAAIAATDPPVWLQFNVDWNIFAFVAAAALASSLGTALLPALQAIGQDAHAGLQQSRRTATQSARSQRWSTVLVAVEVALTLILLSGAGLMIRAFWSLFSTEIGIETGDVTVMRVDVVGPTYRLGEQRAHFYDSLAQRLDSLPAVSGVSVTTSVPGGGFPPQWIFEREGRPADPDNPSLVAVTATGDGYLRTLNRPMIRGRSFEQSDGTPGRGVAIVNQRLVSLLFPFEDALGQRIRVTRAGRTPFDSGWVTVIGIAPTINQTSPLLGRGPDPGVYIPYRAQPAADAMLVARGPDTGSVVQHVRREVLALDPGLAVYDVQSLDTYLAFFRWPQRVFGTVLLVLAAIALVLAAVGLYAIVAYSIVQRTQEIGVRVALGAQRGQILRLLTRRALSPFFWGVVAGTAGVLTVGQLLTAFLAGTNPRDPVTLFGVTALMVIVGVCACLLPARRATRVDPIVALRCE